MAEVTSGTLTVLILTEAEAERLSSILSDVVRGSMQDDPVLAAIADALTN